MPRAPRLLDVSVLLTPGIASYPGNPEFDIQPVNRIAAGDSANNSRLVMGTHTPGRTSTHRSIFSTIVPASTRCRSICSSAARA
jgi:hypothetical protein